MSQVVEIKVPDIGDYKDVPVIEVLVKAGDTVNAEDSLVTLESDKATMDVPSPKSGVVKEVKIKVGDTVSEGSLVLLLEEQGAAAAPAPAPQAAPAPAPAAAAPAPAPAAQAPAPAPAAAGGGTVEVKVPDIGDYTDVPVIEISVKVGDRVEAEQSLITLESDKATMDVPSPAAGTVKEIRVKVGDAVSQGTLIVVLEGAGGAAAAPAPAQAQVSAPAAAAPSPAPAAAPAVASTAAPATYTADTVGYGWQGCSRQPLGAQVRARAGRQRESGRGHGSEEPHHAGRRAALRQGRDERPGCGAGQGCRGCTGRWR